MYTSPANSSSIHLRLTPDMIERRLNVQPYEIIVDVPLMFDRLPEDAQQKILEALAADASVNVEEVQQNTITVYAGISCDLRHNARSCPESRTAVALVGRTADDVCITAYAMTTPEAGEEPVGAIMDNIAPLFDLDPATLKETSTNDEQTYLDYIVDDLCLLALENESTTFDLFKKSTLNEKD